LHEVLGLRVVGHIGAHRMNSAALSAPPTRAAGFTATGPKAGDRYRLPSGRVVQVVSATGWIACACRYMRLGAVDMSADSVVTLTVDFLETHGRKI
jgi:hypothetical protein